MPFITPDLCDANPNSVTVLEPLFKTYGGKPAFCGEVVTIKCFEDNSVLKQQAGLPGHGRVMVVDGGGSLRKALLGDMIAANAVKNDWAGLIINGCIRDVDAIASLDLGVKALNSIPLKTEKLGVGDLNIPIHIAGADIHPGEYIYADNNGIIISASPLLP